MDVKTKVGFLTPLEHRLLGEGVLYLHDWSNAAPGTDGGAINSLAARGLLSVTRDYHQNCWRHTVTPAGRDAYVSYGPPAVPVTDDLAP